MRKAVPTPELISAGVWKKTDDKSARVGLSEREYYAPCDLSDSSADIRKHEYGHIKYSEPRQNAPIDFDMNLGGTPETRELHDIAGAFEDHRVNFLMKTLNDISVAHVGDELYSSLAKGISKMPPSFAAKVYVSSRMYATPKGFDAKLRAQFETTADQVDALIEKLNSNPTTENMYQVCRDFKKIFEEDEQKQKDKSKEPTEEPQESNSPGKGSSDDKKKEDKEEKKEKPESQPKPTPKKKAALKPEQQQAQKMEKKYSLVPPSNTPSLTEMAKTKKKEFEFEQEKEAVAGEMTISYNPGKMRQADRYKGVRLRPKRKASAYGAALRYTNRILTDKACFSAPMRDNLGTVLVDVSGSMHMDIDALKKMMTFAGRATVAIYSGGPDYYTDKGDNTTGILHILAKGGRCVSEIPTHAHLNIIDGPALEWLVSQPGPRWWISDGYATGVQEATGPMVSERCYNACVKGKVRQVFSVEQFIDLIEGNKVRNYKQQYQILGLNENGKWNGR